jgi:hypothetical protein
MVGLGLFCPTKSLWSCGPALEHQRGAITVRWNASIYTSHKLAVGRPQVNQSKQFDIEVGKVVALECVLDDRARFFDTLVVTERHTIGDIGGAV